jgi:hypothetical protein
VLIRYAKDRETEQHVKSAEFRAAKRIEEEALMAALGIKVMPSSMPPPPTPAGTYDLSDLVDV